jgi:uncharacterized protein YbjT (DUF2867 family)
MKPRGGQFLFLSGATGHTGSRAARRLLEQGWRLRCLNHDPDHARRLPQSGNLEVIRGDLAQPEPWLAALRGAAAFINMAHVGFGRQVVQACEAAGVRRVIALSSTRRFTRFPEATARRVSQGEAAFESSALDYTILRPAMIFGGERDNNLEKLVRWLRRRRWLPLLAGGRNLVQPIFTWDLVDAIVRALERPETTARRALTLAGPRAMTQRELVETVARAMGRPVLWIPAPYAAAMAGAAVLEFLMKRPLLTRAQIRRTLEDKAFDISEASQALGGWQPRPFEEAIRMKLAGKA